MNRVLLGIALLTVGAIGCHQSPADDPSCAAARARTVAATSPAADPAPERPDVPTPPVSGDGFSITTDDGTKVTTSGSGATVDTGDTHLDTTGGRFRVEAGGVKIDNGNVTVSGVEDIETD